MKKVFIVGTSFFHQFHSMYTKRGYTIVDSIDEADIVQFTGGADISPKFYNQHEHPTTYTSPGRDREEYAAFVEGKQKGKFLAGVCRGGQLLNALSGGNMYQDVKGHGIHGTHDMLDVETGKLVPVSSLHHQMMIVGERGILLGKSSIMRSSRKFMMTPAHEEPGEVVDVDTEVEVEACFYPSTKAFCYQPHPEFVSSDHPCQQWYFDKLEELYAQV